MTDPVVNSVTKESSDDKKNKKKGNIKGILGGKGAGGKEKRIAREEGGDNKAGFHKNDKEENCVA